MRSHQPGLLTVLAVAVTLISFTPTSLQAEEGRIRLLGTSNVGSGGTGGTSFGNPLRSSSGEDEGGELPFLPTHNRKPLYKKGPQLPNPSSATVKGPDSSYAGFPGLNIIDHLSADGGNQFGLEPPDQALAVGNGYVLEAVNTTLVIYNSAGAVLSGPTSLNQFFTGDHQYDVAAGTYGAFLSDPSAYYDAAVGRWFLTILEIDQDPVTGAFDPSHTSVLVAVSQTANPTGAWWIYEVTTTDIGIPDYPMIGTDANGLYITVNSFTFPDMPFAGAYIYAVQKAALVSGSPAPNIVQVGSLLDQSGVGLQPATVPPGGGFSSANHGTEYFMSTLDLDGTLDNEILVWALTNTASLNNAAPSLSLARQVVHTQSYGFPPPAEQRDGSTPLLDLLVSGGYTGSPLDEELSKIASNDDAMHQVVFADGKLWGMANTVVKSSNQQRRTGLAYFVVQPSWTNAGLQASVVKQGYVSVQNNSCLMPSLGVTKDGRGVMTFTVVGPNYYPTIAYARIDAKNGAGPVQLVASSGLPEDGFTGYELFTGGDVARWGDYSACAVDETGQVWFAGEITQADRLYLFANWATHIGHVRP